MTFLISIGRPLHNISLQGSYNKLNNKKFGPFTILEKFNDNAYKMDLLKSFNVSNIFNILDMFPYQVPDEFKLST